MRAPSCGGDDVDYNPIGINVKSPFFNLPLVGRVDRLSGAKAVGVGVIAITMTPTPNPSPQGGFALEVDFAFFRKYLPKSA